MLASRLRSLLPPLALLAVGCSSEQASITYAVAAPCAGLAPLSAGDPSGHPDPFGAKAAGQARASRLADVSVLAQPAHGRQPLQDGDFLLINDKIAVAIEAAGLSDGYGRFGGEILAIDRVGDNGFPAGESLYGETLTGLSAQMVNPESVTVLKDGSDGGEAIVRALGPLESIPFVTGPLAVIFPVVYQLRVAFDYVLAPGAEAVTIRVSVQNDSPEPIDFGLERPGSDELYGFFHSSRSQLVTPEAGFGKPEPYAAWVGFDGGPWSFAWRQLNGPLEYGIAQSGFVLFLGPGFVADGCAVTEIDRVEIVAGGPQYDGLREAVRRVSGESPWRAVTGTVRDAKGAAVGGAWVHAIGGDESYLSRTQAAADGSFSIHLPDAAVALVPQMKGFPLSEGALVGADAAQADLTLPPVGTLHVTATDQGSGVPLPVRIQVIPTLPLAPTPDSYGVLDEVNGRLHQEFAVTGEARLTVPPGEHRVIVSRGYEWELLDTTVNVAAGETFELAASLEHSVDSAGILCGDFHIHSWNSADSNDPVEHKVKGAIADGLEIPVSSEHEWVIDFQPVIEELGLTPWAFGVSSEELTTFTWGHFGVVPVVPKPGQFNNGAIDWIGKAPAEVFADVDALAEKPALIVNHPSNGGFQAYFSAAQLDHETGRGSDEMWSDNFDAVEVFNDSDFEDNRDGSVRDWFGLLNAGLRVAAVGSSDSHDLRTSPVGYPRTCFFFGHDDPRELSLEAVRDALLSGASTISGGALLTVTGPDGELPGDTVPNAAGGVTLIVTVQAPGFVSVDTLEVIVNGVSVDTQPLLPLGAGTAHRFVNLITVSADAAKERSWVVLHARGESDLSPLHPGRRAFAASNPIFLTP
jgi:hypothetical protein